MGPRRTRQPFCLVVKQSCAILLQLPEPSHPAFLGFDFAAKGTCFRVEPAALKRPPETICFRRFFRYLPRSFMAKTSWVNRNERKRATVKKYAALRAELKAKKHYAGLAQLPRNASPTRVVNRCQVSGRRRAFIRRFKISRLTFRELASSGLIPGVTKSSW